MSENRLLTMEEFKNQIAKPLVKRFDNVLKKAKELNIEVPEKFGISEINIIADKILEVEEERRKSCQKMK